MILGWHHVIWPKWSKFLLDLQPQTWVKFHKRFRNASRFVVCTWPLLPKATVQWSCINYSKMIDTLTHESAHELEWDIHFDIERSEQRNTKENPTQKQRCSATPWPSTCWTLFRSSTLRFEMPTIGIRVCKLVILWQNCQSLLFFVFIYTSFFLNSLNHGICSMVVFFSGVLHVAHLDSNENMVSNEDKMLPEWM